MGTLCSGPPNMCRSGICADFNSEDAVPEQCSQTCTAEGGCPVGMACRPQVLDGSIQLFCAAAGRGDIGSPCARAADCSSALCDLAGAVCLRLCVDGICPTGWRCEAVTGSSIGICRR